MPEVTIDQAVQNKPVITDPVHAAFETQRAKQAADDALAAKAAVKVAPNLDEAKAPVAEPAAAATPPGEPVVTAEEKVKASAFAALARKERRAKQQEAELRAKETALAAEAKRIADLEKSATDRIQGYDRVTGLLREGKEMEALKYMGIDFDKVVRDQITKGAPDPTSVVRSELEKFRAELRADQEKVAAEQVRQHREAELKQGLASALSHIKALAEEGDKFELVKVSGAEQMVLDVMQETFNLTGESPSFEEALAQTEEYLMTTTKDLLSKSKKLSGVLKDTPAATSPTSSEPTATPEEVAAITAKVDINRIQAYRKGNTGNKPLPGGVPTTAVQAKADKPPSRDAQIAQLVSQMVHRT